MKQDQLDFEPLYSKIEITLEPDLQFAIEGLISICLVNVLCMCVCVCAWTQLSSVIIQRNISSEVCDVWNVNGMTAQTLDHAWHIISHGMFLRNDHLALALLFEKNKADFTIVNWTQIMPSYLDRQLWSKAIYFQKKGIQAYFKSNDT